MADLSKLIVAVKKNIHDNLEGKITGQRMQKQLIDIINILNSEKLDSKSEISELETSNKTIVGAINEINSKTNAGAPIEYVQKLPPKGVSNKIYVIKSKTETNENIYLEYIWINSAWELLGNPIDIDEFASQSLTYEEILENTQL